MEYSSHIDIAQLVLLCQEVETLQDQNIQLRREIDHLKSELVQRSPRRYYPCPLFNSLMPLLTRRTVPTVTIAPPQK